MHLDYADVESKTNEASSLERKVEGRAERQRMTYPFDPPEATAVPELVGTELVEETNCVDVCVTTLARVVVGAVVVRGVEVVETGVVVAVRALVEVLDVVVLLVVVVVELVVVVVVVELGLVVVVVGLVKVVGEALLVVVVVAAAVVDEVVGDVVVFDLKSAV